MIIQQKSGNLNSLPAHHKTIDWLTLQWYETTKRILHKRTQNGIEITMKFLGENQQLTQGDILHQDAETIIAVDIEACDTIIISPQKMHEMAYVCYEIGNKHLPLFYEDDTLLVPYEAPLFKLLTAAGYPIKVEKRKLLNQLKTTVTPHTNNSNSTSLFSKIMQLTNPAE